LPNLCYLKTNLDVQQSGLRRQFLVEKLELKCGFRCV
jgi:hypothetical protein